MQRLKSFVSQAAVSKRQLLELLQFGESAREHVGQGWAGQAQFGEFGEILTALTNLRELDVTSTKLTASGIAKLQEALPKCKITTAAADSNKK